MSIGGLLRVLIVEDEALLAYALEEDLRSAGYETVGPFRNLSTALRAASEEKFEIGLLDINLGGELSYPVAEKLLMRGIPFVFLSGYGAESIPEVFQTYPRLAKPYDTPQLLRRLNDLAGKTAGSANR
jgi:two-component system, response regulator PdtaR